MYALIPLLMIMMALLSVVAVTALIPRATVLTAPSGRPWLRRSRVRCLSAVGAATAVGVGGVVWGTAVPQLVGLPLALTPGLAAVAGLVAFAAIPDVRPGESPVRSAALTPRHPWSYGHRTSLILPGTLGLVTVAVLVLTGWSSAPDETGRYREIDVTDGTMSVGHGPYPGWFYAVPLIAVTVVLTAAVWLALIRVARSSAPPVPELLIMDEQLRRTSVVVILRLGSAALLSQLGGVLLSAGIGLRGIAGGFLVNARPAPEGYLELGLLAVVLGLGALVAGVLMAGFAALAAVRPRVQVVTPASPVTA